MKVKFMKKPSTVIHNCESCKLSLQCKSPAMQVSGEGKLKILILTEMPSNTDDNNGRRFSDASGLILQNELKKHNLVLNRDFWLYSAINCTSYTKNKIATKEPTRKQINCCRTKVKNLIKELKPKQTWIFGKSAIISLLGENFRTLTPNRFRGLHIPDRELSTWFVPFFAPSFLGEKDRDFNLKAVFSRDITNAVRNMNKKFPDFENELKQVTFLTDFKTAENALIEANKNAKVFFFDYETNRLKPHVDGCKIVCLSFCYKDRQAYSMPFDLKSFWSRIQLEKLQELFVAILKNKKIRKAAHNMSFEEMWSRKILGVKPTFWGWCSQTAAHILDNRASYTNLKFQTYINYGVKPYDETIGKFLNSKSKSGFNTVMDAPLVELLLYCGLDSLFGYRLTTDQMAEFKKMPNKRKALQLFINANSAQSDMHANGVCIDSDYYKNQDAQLEIDITNLKRELINGTLGNSFLKQEGKEILLTSSKDLAILLYDIMKIPPVLTEKGNRSVSADSLNLIKTPFTDKLLVMRKKLKIQNTYLSQYNRENENGKLHPLFGLNIPRSYRGCIAKGMKVLVMRDFEKSPEGVSIENVKVGDFVYCFDANLNPQIKPVLWAGKTGHKEVIRVHYYRKGRKGYFDCTPEHKVRLITGEYVEAQNLLKKEHYKRENKHSQKCRVLACSRHYDTLNFTGHLKYNTGIYEHRLIYKTFFGELSKNEVIHHKDKNHLNHNILNLEKHTKSTHDRLHAKDTIWTTKAKENSNKAIKLGWKEGKYIKRGWEEHYKYLNLTHYQCLRILAKCAGKIKIATTRAHIDFDTFKRYLNKFNINWKEISLRYDKYGKYISKKRLQKLSLLGRARVRKKIGHNYYRLIALYNFYGIDTKRNWANQFGKFKLGNHVITKIEWLNKKEDVYDLEVENCHNFFVEEICVHNSVSNPNLQNTPIRDEEAKRICRGGILPSKGNKLLEADFSGIEVCCSVMYHHDPKMIQYITDPTTNMHRDVSCDLWKTTPDQITKDIRQHAKGGWTFAQFYGDWYKNCAKNLWENCKDLPLVNGNIIINHLHNEGITCYNDFVAHCKDVEYIFWKKRFKVYDKWKYKINEFYQQYGYTENYFGFRFTGYMDRKQVTNYVIQSTAFHILLWTLIQLNNVMKEENLKSKLILQVHDSVILDLVPEEQNYVVKTLKNIAEIEVRKNFSWVNVPLKIEFEATEIEAPWSTKKELI